MENTERTIVKTLNEYQTAAMKTCMSKSFNDAYMLLGLTEEVGELNGKFSKAIRKGKVCLNEQNNFDYLMSGEEEREFRDSVKKEISDVLWMAAGFCKVMGWTLESVCQLNIDKLADRAGRGVIVGEGDNR